MKVKWLKRSSVLMLSLALTATNFVTVPGVVQAASTGNSAISTSEELSVEEYGNEFRVDPNLKLMGDVLAGHVTNGNLNGASVMISNVKTGDKLSFTDPSGKINGTYNPKTGILTLKGEATIDDYQTALQNVTFSTISTDVTARAITFTLGSALSFAETGHFYEYINKGAAITWQQAKDDAQGKSYFGRQGYLVTITSQEENNFVKDKTEGLGWIGAADIIRLKSPTVSAANGGDWRWVTGPEGLKDGGNGLAFWQGYIGKSPVGKVGPVGDMYNNWQSGEPNDSTNNANKSEYVAHIFGPGSTSGQWNDYNPTTPYSAVKGYVIEYGGMENDQTFAISATKTIEDPVSAELKITAPSGDPAQVTVPAPEIKGEAKPGSTVKVIIKDKDGKEVTGAGGDAKVRDDGTWTFTPAVDLTPGEYTIEAQATDGTKIAAKTQKINVVLPAPELETAELKQSPQDGNRIILTFDQEVELTSREKAGFTITVDGQPITINDDNFKVDPSNPKNLIITLPADTDVSQKEVKVAYDGMGNLKGKNGTSVQDFTRVAAKVDKSLLKAKVDEARSLTESKYTPASWANLERELTEANSVLNDPDANQAQVNQALADLQEALDSLVVLSGELEELNLVGLTNDAHRDIQLTPGFDPNQKNYTGTVTNDVYGISLQPVAKYPDDTQVKVFVEGKEYPADEWSNLPLNEGKNEITVVVYDKAGEPINKYTYIINRESAVPAANKLESLVPSVGNLSPAFDPSQDSYTMSVANSVYQIQWTPTALDPNATIQIRVNDGEWIEVPNGQISENLALNVGLNNIVVKVTGKDGSFKEYTVKVTREYSGNHGGDNTGNTGNTGGTTTAPTPDNPVKPGNIITTDNGSNVSFASGTVNGDQATVTIDKDKLSGILADGKGHKLGIRVPGNGDVEVRGLTLEGLKKIADTGSSLEIEDVLAIYPVPAGQLDVDAISKQFGNAPISDIAANIKIKRSADDLAKMAREKATQGGYELLVHPVDLDLSFMHDGKTDRAGLLNGYAPKYIALPEGIDPNRITTGVIVNPDGSVFHVPTVVTKVNNRYFALINDLRSSGTYSVIWNPQDFDDVQYHWGRADVNNIAARLDLKGNGDNTFSPNRYVTRSEFAEIVVLGLGLMRQDAPQNIYPDVPSTAWYRNAVALADEFDIVRGYEDGNFKGGQQITREQGFAMIARAYRLIQSVDVPNQEQLASTLAPYADGAKVASWAKADVAQLIAAGIIQGNGPEHLSPKAGMTRAEVTALIARMLKVTNLIDK